MTPRAFQYRTPSLSTAAPTPRILAFAHFAANAIFADLLSGSRSTLNSMNRQAPFGSMLSAVFSGPSKSSGVPSSGTPGADEARRPWRRLTSSWRSRVGCGGLRGRALAAGHDARRGNGDEEADEQMTRHSCSCRTPSLRHGRIRAEPYGPAGPKVKPGNAVPRPARAARSNASSAMAVSCTPTPVSAHTEISSARSPAGRASRRQLAQLGDGDVRRQHARRQRVVELAAREALHLQVARQPVGAPQALALEFLLLRRRRRPSP